MRYKLYRPGQRFPFAACGSKREAIELAAQVARQFNTEVYVEDMRVNPSDFVVGSNGKVTVQH